MQSCYDWTINPEQTLASVSSLDLLAEIPQHTRVTSCIVPAAIDGADARVVWFPEVWRAALVTNGNSVWGTYRFDGADTCILTPDDPDAPVIHAYMPIPHA